MSGEQRTFSIGGAWGFHVEWLDFPKHKVHGHWTPPPRLGDLLRSEMKSGRVGVFRFVSVKRMHDPPDQFFGEVEAVGYEDEL